MAQGNYEESHNMLLVFIAINICPIVCIMEIPFWSCVVWLEANQILCDL